MFEQRFQVKTVETLYLDLLFLLVAAAVDTVPLVYQEVLVVVHHIPTKLLVLVMFILQHHQTSPVQLLGKVIMVVLPRLWHMTKLVVVEEDLAVLV